jgi:hypothetical protein
LQVQYAFLELPKLPAKEPETGAGYWAWSFVHAPELTEVPADLPPGPLRAALELANEATFTQEERDAYQKAIDESQQVRELAEAKLVEGGVKARRDTLVRLLGRAGIAITENDLTRILACEDNATLDRWVDNVPGAKTAADVLT